MNKAQAKTINLLLHEGDLNGVISLADSSWNAGELYSAPRESLDELIDTGICSKYGVYLLYSKNSVYVGQSSDLAKRITQHIIGKDWWENVAILTTSDDSFNHADIDYLESKLIEKAVLANSLQCENKNKGNQPKVTKFRQVLLDQYLEEAFFLFELIGVKVFSGKKDKRSTRAIDVIDQKTTFALGKRVKNEVLEFLKENKIDLEKSVNYSVYNEAKNEYWINPRASHLHKDWNIVLNNTKKNQLIVLKIPADSLSLNSEKKGGLYIRNDRPELLDLNINADTFIDRKSKTSFMKYISAKIDY